LYLVVPSVGAAFFPFSRFACARTPVADRIIPGKTKTPAGSAAIFHGSSGLAFILQQLHGKTPVAAKQPKARKSKLKRK